MLQIERMQFEVVREHLASDLIKSRNKPLEAPKAPEKAPFFIPARVNLGVSSVTQQESMALKRNQGIDNSSDKSDQNISSSKSRLLSGGGQRHKTELMRLLASFEEHSASSSKKMNARQSPQ